MVTFQKENGIVFDHPARARKMVTFQKENAHFEVDQHIPLPLNSMPEMQKVIKNSRDKFLTKKKLAPKMA